MEQNTTNGTARSTTAILTRTRGKKYTEPYPFPLSTSRDLDDGMNFLDELRPDELPVLFICVDAVTLSVSFGCISVYRGFEA